MRKSILVLSLLTVVCLKLNGQPNNGWIVQGGFDLFKTDNDGFADKVQLGAEANYFLKRNFAITGGYEIWSESNNSLVLGARFYPEDPFFFRFRALLSGNTDAALGGGYSHNISGNWSVVINGDYFMDAAAFSLRLSMAYRF